MDKGLKKGLGSKWYVQKAEAWWGYRGRGVGIQHQARQEVLCSPPPPRQSRREPVLQSCHVMTQKGGQCLVGAEAE